MSLQMNTVHHFKSETPEAHLFRAKQLNHHADRPNKLLFYI